MAILRRARVWAVVVALAWLVAILLLFYVRDPDFDCSGGEEAEVQALQLLEVRGYQRPSLGRGWVPLA